MSITFGGGEQFRVSPLSRSFPQSVTEKRASDAVGMGRYPCSPWRLPFPGRVGGVQQPRPKRSRFRCTPPSPSLSAFSHTNRYTRWPDKTRGGGGKSKERFHERGTPFVKTTPACRFVISCLITACTRTVVSPPFASDPPAYLLSAISGGCEFVKIEKG